MPPRVVASGRRAGLMVACVALATATSVAARRDDEAMLARLRQSDLRVATIAFRLATGGVAICPDHAPLSGMLIHDVRQYAIGLRPVATRLFEFAGRPAVQAVVAGSPADQAGIRAGDGIAAIDGVAIPAVAVPQPDRRRPSYDLAGAVQQQFDRALGRGPVHLSLDRGGTVLSVEVRPVSGCVSAVQLLPNHKRDAWSNGRGVVVTSRLAAIVASDDELAAIIGHELAHNILHHAQRDMRGAKASRVREVEREADYVGVYLVARAGYDPAAAAAFWRRYGKEYGDGWFVDTSHPGWRDRTAALAAAAAEIAAKRARGLALLPEAMPAR
jgi:hypothetical protein